MSIDKYNSIIMSKEDKPLKEDIMHQTFALAEYSVANGGGPFGAIIAKTGTTKKEIIGIGHNQVTLTNDPTAHAEIVAIRNACKNLDTHNLTGYTMFTSCEPCPMCLSAIYWANIDAIYYSNDRVDAANIGFNDDFIYNEFNKPLNKRQIPIERLNIEERKKAFELWSEKTDKNIY